MKLMLIIFAAVHGLMAVLFALAALVILYLAAREGWLAIASGVEPGSAQGVIEAVGLLAAAVVALQISQTIVEEEIVRFAHVSGPTRVRRFLSRFFVVVVVALGMEGLVATFKAVHEDLAYLPFAASLLLGTAAVMAGWGVFVRLNRAAEELEPEAMQEAKEEDEKMR
jgi:hypothetical protein